MVPKHAVYASALGFTTHTHRKKKEKNLGFESSVRSEQAFMYPKVTLIRTLRTPHNINVHYI